MCFAIGLGKQSVGVYIVVLISDTKFLGVINYT